MIWAKLYNILSAKISISTVLCNWIWLQWPPNCRENSYEKSLRYINYSHSNFDRSCLLIHGLSLDDYHWFLDDFEGNTNISVVIKSGSRVCHMISYHPLQLSRQNIRGGRGRCSCRCLSIIIFTPECSCVKVCISVFISDSLTVVLALTPLWNVFINVFRKTLYLRSTALWFRQQFLAAL